MFGIAFVCFLWELCWALGLSVSWLGYLCLALRLSVFVGAMLGIGFVYFLVGGLMFGIAFVCFLWELCCALGLSVTLLGDLCLEMVVIWKKHS